MTVARCPRCGAQVHLVPGRPPVCDACWSATPSRVRRAVIRLDARAQRSWADGNSEVAPAPRKKRSSRKHRDGAAAEPAAASAPADPERLSFLAGAVAPPPPPPSARSAAALPEAAEDLRPPAPPPAELRREQARLRRAALIADQLGDRDLPLYLVDFMVVEDAAATLGFEPALAAVARREGRDPTELEDAWHRAVERIAHDERCRYVDALRPYIERIDAEFEDGEGASADGQP